MCTNTMTSMQCEKTTPYRCKTATFQTLTGRNREARGRRFKLVITVFTE